MDPGQPSATSVPWWGSYALDEGVGGRWKIGPCTLWVVHTESDWQVYYRQSADALEDGLEHVLPLASEELDGLLGGQLEDITAARFSFRRAGHSLRLEPVLADRPVVARPEMPLYVPPGEEVTLFVSSPLWIRLVLEEENHFLHEVPSIRPSDTWFGPSTMEGELCYAIRTAGRLRLEAVQRRPHRAVTSLRIVNQGTTVLAFERVQIPARYLTLYRDEENLLWTEAATLVRREGEAGASVRIEKGAPRQARHARKVQEPRQVLKKNLVTSTFSALGSIFGT